MSSNAPGQLLGYTIQYPRALYRLLSCSPGDCVSVEVFGDVATEHSTGSLTTEEDKSSVTGNPLTNRSTDLWKTFSNWVNAVLSGDLDVMKTSFILYTNQTGREALVDKFHVAFNDATAKEAYDETIKELIDLPEDHPIRPSFDFVVKTHAKIFLQIIQRFELQKGKGAASDEVLTEIRKKHISDANVDEVAKHLTGWLVGKISDALAQRKPARVTWEDLDREVGPVFRRFQRLALIDFALTPSSEVVNAIKREMPLYLRQLRLISCDDDELIRAVTHFIKAKSNRQAWIEKGHIDEQVASEFEGNLTEYWRNTMTTVSLAHSGLTPENQGKMVLAECSRSQVKLNEQTPPPGTIPGTYHSLVNDKECGWHKDWQNKCK